MSESLKQLPLLNVEDLSLIEYEFENVWDVPVKFTGVANFLKSGSTFYYVNGKFHRENNQPACISGKNRKVWWVDGQKHRTDGPAVIWEAEMPRFFLFGNEFMKNDYFEAVERLRKAEETAKRFILKLERFKGVFELELISDPNLEGFSFFVHCTRNLMNLPEEFEEIPVYPLVHRSQIKQSSLK